MDRDLMLIFQNQGTIIPLQSLSLTRHSFIIQYEYQVRKFQKPWTAKRGYSTVVHRQLSNGCA